MITHIKFVYVGFGYPYWPLVPFKVPNKHIDQNKSIPYKNEVGWLTSSKNFHFGQKIKWKQGNRFSDNKEWNFRLCCLGQKPNLNTQFCIRSPLCSTLKFENFDPKINSKNIQNILSIKDILCNFFVRMLQFFQKKSNFFICHWRHEKSALKSC